jgi:hypothetical protein
VVEVLAVVEVAVCLVAARENDGFFTGNSLPDFVKHIAPHEALFAHAGSSVNVYPPVNFSTLISVSPTASAPAHNSSNKIRMVVPTPSVDRPHA